MMPPPGQQAQQLALHVLGFGRGQDAAAQRDGGVTRDDDLSFGTGDRLGLLHRQPQRMNSRQFGGARRFVDIGRGGAVGHDSQPRQQIAAARGGGCKDERHVGPVAHLKR